MIGSNINWQNKNSFRSYPLEDGTTSFPSDVLVDIFVVFQEDEAFPYAAEIIKTDSIVSVSFRCKSSGATLFVAQNIRGNGVIQPAPGVDCSGNVTFGDCSSIRNGRYEYSPYDNTSLVDHCYVCVAKPTIRSLSVPGSARVEGECSIDFVGSLEQKVSAAKEKILGEKTTIATKLGSSKESFLQLCYPAMTTCECEKKPIKQINTVFPDKYGNIILESRDMVVRIDNSAPFGTIYLSAVALPEDKCEANKNLPTIEGLLKGYK